MQSRCRTRRRVRLHRDVLQFKTPPRFKRRPVACRVSSGATRNEGPECLRNPGRFSLTRGAPVFAGCNYSIRTEYLRRLGATVCLVHVRRHPRDMGATEIEVFLSHLAIADKVSASIRNPAKSAPRFLYRQVLRIDELWLTVIASVRQGKRLPVVLTVAEVWGTLARIPGRTGLMLRRRYGSGLRLMECVRLRVKKGIEGQLSGYSAQAVSGGSSPYWAAASKTRRHPG